LNKKHSCTFAVEFVSENKKSKYFIPIFSENKDMIYIT